MNKSTIHISVHPELIEVAKAKMINISQFCETALREELDFTDAEEEIRRARLLNEIKIKKQELNILEKKIKEETK